MELWAKTPADGLVQRLHFADEETEAERAPVPCLELHGRAGHGLLASRPVSRWSHPVCDGTSGIGVTALRTR